VRRGRVSKSRSSVYVNNTNSLLSDHRMINGVLSRNSSNKLPGFVVLDESDHTAMLLRESEQRTFPLNYPQGRKRSLLRAALLSCGIAASVGAAVLLSSSSSISWDKLSLPAFQMINRLREKFYNFMH